MIALLMMALILHVPATGNSRTSGEDRLMDWGFIIERSFSTMFGVEVMVFAMAAVGLNIQFGYAGLLNFGQVGFMAAGAYGLGVSINYFQWNFWRRVALRSRLLDRARADPRCAHPATAGRLPRDRHDRGVRDDPTVRALAQMKEITGASEGIGEFADPFYDVALNPFNPVNDTTSDRSRTSAATCGY